MPPSRDPARERHLQSLLTRDHTLRGGILFGLEGHVIELQARAMEVLRGPATSWRGPVGITGMARDSVREALDRIAGAFAKLTIPFPEVEILVNLIPPDLPKDGTWLDLPLAVIILQAAGILPDLSQAREDAYILVGEIGLHGEVRRARRPVHRLRGPARPEADRPRRQREGGRPHPGQARPRGLRRLPGRHPQAGHPRSLA